MKKRKDGRYQQSITINGKRKVFYGKSKAEVLRKMQAYTDDASAGKRFKAVAEEWWADHSQTMAYNSQKPYIPAIKRAVERLGDVPIKDIKPPMIAAHIRDFAKAYADKTVRTQLMIYNQICQYAVERGYAPYNAARDLKVPSGLSKRKVHMPSSHDIEAVKANINLPFGKFAYWILYTGLRRGELLALDWSDVDFESRTITVSKSVYDDGTAKVKPPKTESSIGKVPILDALLFAIKKDKHKGLVFPAKDGGYMRSGQFEVAWRNYAKAAGITATPHQFRHAYATMLYEAGVQPAEMQALLRHAQISTTMDIYRDIRDQQLQRTAKKIYSIDIA